VCRGPRLHYRLLTLCRAPTDEKQGKSHTDPILEDPAELGGVDPLILDLLSHIHPDEHERVGGVGAGLGVGGEGRGLASWLPRCVVVPCVHIARRLNPF